MEGAWQVGFRRAETKDFAGDHPQLSGDRRAGRKQNHFQVYGLKSQLGYDPMEYSSSEIKKVLGEPLKSSESFMLYENAAFFFEKDSNIIEGIHINETKELSIHGYPGTTIEELSNLNSESSDKSNILKNELGVEPIAYSYQQGMYNLEYDLPV